MTGMADIHCHMIPYVDDGAERMEEAKELLLMESTQGVRTICVTPHLRKGMFESSDEMVQTEFQDLKKTVEEMRLPIRLYLGREYFCDSAFFKRLKQGDVWTLGEGNTLLVEFSGRHSYEMILERVKNVIQAGYEPLIAHIERFQAKFNHIEQVEQLVELGAKIQVNADSILGHAGFRQKQFCRKLMRANLIHVVASDAHDPEDRPPELEACAHYLEKKMGKLYAQNLLRHNPLQILNLQ